MQDEQQASEAVWERSAVEWAVPYWQHAAEAAMSSQAEPRGLHRMTAMWSLQWYWRRGRVNSTDVLMDSIKK